MGNYSAVHVAAAKIMHLNECNHKTSGAQISYIIGILSPHLLKTVSIFLLFILQFGDLNAVSPGNMDKGKHFSISRV